VTLPESRRLFAVVPDEDADRAKDMAITQYRHSVRHGASQYAEVQSCRDRQRHYVLRVPLPHVP